MKKLGFILLATVLLVCGLGLGGVASAAFLESPHDALDCGDCHVAHSTGGPALEKEANANLCISCHNGIGSVFSFNSGDQADPGVSGTSHSWTVTLDPSTCFPDICGPDSRYGVRKPAADPSSPQPDEIQSYDINIMLSQFNYVITCSVCHQQHRHSQGASWDPTDSGTATGGSSNTVQDTNKTWTISQWVYYVVKLTSGPSSGEIRYVQSNDGNTITVTSNFSNPVTSGTTYSVYGGDFQRVDNDLNQLCEDCHYYRVATPYTDVRTYDGNLKSHPVGVVFTNANGETPDISDTTGFNTAPLETSGDAQTGSRYHLNGGTDTNLTNNLVVDRLAKTRCLTCHGIHFTDSDSATVDGP